jgi:hypothetical protein
MSLVAQPLTVFAMAAAFATAGCAARMGSLSASASPAPPVLFWPPPPPTTWSEEPAALHDASMGDVAVRVQSSLRDAGITTIRWSPIGVGYAHGFVVTTRLERIDDDGAPMKSPDRWSSTFSEAPELSFLAQADAVRLPAAGRYRVLLAAFTDLPVVRPPHSAPRWNEETVLFGHGLSAAGLPYAKRVSPAYRLDVFEYEYEAGEQGEGRFVSRDARLSAERVKLLGAF